MPTLQAALSGLDEDTPKRSSRESLLAHGADDLDDDDDDDDDGELAVVRVHAHVGAWSL
jgi:hypothetical protein